MNIFKNNNKIKIPNRNTITPNIIVPNQDAIVPNPVSCCLGRAVVLPFLQTPASMLPPMFTYGRSC